MTALPKPLGPESLLPAQRSLRRSSETRLLALSGLLLKLGTGSVPWERHEKGGSWGEVMGREVKDWAGPEPLRVPFP